MPEQSLPSGPQPRPGSGGNRAIASLVLGIIGLVAWYIPLLGLSINAVGLVLGIQDKESKNRGLAVAGIFLSILGQIACLIKLLMNLYFSFVEVAGNT